jgi:hypothetical protein
MATPWPLILKIICGAQNLLVECQLFSFELAPIYYFDCAIMTLKYLNEQHTYDIVIALCTT